jgi:glycosyltransferase involved in cell wall biosynthesis
MKLSVITPSLNQARYIGECLDSVRRAGEHAGPYEVEHIVIDGGSTDGTVDLLATRSDIRWISEKDTGQSNAINKGLAMAKGDILAYLCADDLYEPDAVHTVMEAFLQDPQADRLRGLLFPRRRLRSQAPQIRRVVPPGFIAQHQPPRPTRCLVAPTRLRKVRRLR